MTLQSYVGAVLTVEGRAALDLNIKDLAKLLETSKRVNGDKGARGSGEAGGCKAQDEATRQHDIHRIRLDDARKLRSEATVALPPTTRGRLRVGHVAKLLSWTCASRSSMPVPNYQYVQVVGFNEGNCDAYLRKLAYNTPLIAPFIGQKRGYEEEVSLGTSKRLYRLAKVLLPSDQEVLDFLATSRTS